MPERAKIFIAEDNPQFQMLMEIHLGFTDHEIVLKATTLPEALAAIERFEELGVQIATIDGNLTPGVKTGEDGRTLLAAIKSHAPNVKTIGMSGEEMKGVTYDLGKVNVKDIGKIINQL